MATLDMTMDKTSIATEQDWTLEVTRQLKNTREAITALEADAALQQHLVEAARLTATSLLRGGKLLVAGNGGSAADAQHLVAEFVVRLREDRPAMRAVALTVDSSILTAAANDFGYERVFARQVEALGQKGDVFMGISTSGNSPNVVLALEQARSQGLFTLGLTGASSGRMEHFCDLLFKIPTTVTQHIQECHLALEHIYCGLVECFYLEGLENKA